MVRRSRVVHRRMRGKGIGSFLGKVNSFLRKHRVISSLGNAVSGMIPEGKFRTMANLATKGASALGYGRRRRVRRCGRGLRLSGH
jgi:hypothetical protein